MKSVLIAGLYHETHTFLDGRTALGDFTIQQASELLASADDASPLGGALAMGRRLGWQFVPAVAMRAMPGPLVEDKAVEHFWRALAAASVSAPLKRIDGVFLVLHGAMVSESIDDVEGEMLERIRNLPGGDRVPICGVLDLHANFTARMGRYADALVAYRRNPHTDARATAERAAQLLDRLMRTGERPATVWEHPPVLWPPTGTCTDAEPMRSLESIAREMEREDGRLLAVNVLAGFAYADVAEAGVSFTAITLGNEAEARARLNRLRDHALSRRDLGCPKELSVEDALRLAAQHERGPVLLVEPSDNIGAGTPGDGVELLRALVAHNARNAVVVLNDPLAVAAATNLEIGQHATLTMGARDGRWGTGPLTLDVELVATSDGAFTLEDPQSHLASMAGSRIEMGPSVVVRHEGVTILLTSRKTPPFDLGQLRSQGIKPERCSIIAVKAAVAHRRAYDPIATASYTVDTLGPCPNNLAMLPYAKAIRPVYPLDEIPFDHG